MLKAHPDNTPMMYQYLLLLFAHSEFLLPDSYILLSQKAFAHHYKKKSGLIYRDPTESDILLLFLDLYARYFYNLL